jgi:hypothetical protein
MSRPIGSDLQTEVLASTAGMDQGNQDTRLVALDSYRIEYKGNVGVTSFNTQGVRVTMQNCTFKGLPIEDFNGLRIQTRPFSTYALSGIATAAGQSGEPRLKITKAPGIRKPSGTVRLANLGNVSDEGHVLDLASGNRLKWDPGGDAKQQFARFKNRRQGDLAWDGRLVAIRGALVKPAGASESFFESRRDDDASDYGPLKDQMPLLITTAEGDHYLAVVSETDGGLIVKYDPVDPK